MPAREARQTPDHVSITLPNLQPTSSNTLTPEITLLTLNILLVGICAYVYAQDNSRKASSFSHIAIWLAATSFTLMAQVLNLTHSLRPNPCISIFKHLTIMTAGLFVTAGIYLDRHAPLGEPRKTLS